MSFPSGGTPEGPQAAGCLPPLGGKARARGLPRTASVLRCVSAWARLEVVRYRAGVLLRGKAKAERGQAAVNKIELFPAPF